RRGRGRLGRALGWIVVGNDPTDGGENLLHRGLLTLRRLRHVPAQSSRLRVHFRVWPNQLRFAESARKKAYLSTCKEYDTSNIERKETLVDADKSAWITLRLRDACAGTYANHVLHERSRFESTSVGDAHAAPSVAHLVIVHDRIVDLDLQAEDLRREAADRRQQRIGRHHPIALRGD